MSAVLELVCGRCGHLFMRWDSGEPHDGHAIDHQAVRPEAPGSYLPASDGKYYRWAPGPAAETPDGRALAEQPDLIALLAEVREQLDYRRSQMVVTLRPLIT